MTREVGKLFVLIGVLFAAAGVALLLRDRLPWLGRLPGDVVVRRGRFAFYFPLATCLLASVVLSLLLRWFLRR